MMEEPVLKRLKKYLTSYPLLIFLFVSGILLSPSPLIWLLAAILCHFLRSRFSIGPFRTAVLFALVGFLILEASLFRFMIRERILEDRFSGRETMIILGAGIVGTEPDLYLRLRLDAAAEVLEQHPDMSVIVTGSQAADEVISEADAMKRYLLRKGLDEGRILVEDQGYDIIRNFEFSEAIIRKKSLPRNVIIVTNDFHSFRAQAIARRYALEPESLSVPSPGLFRSRYFIREALSLIKVQLTFGPGLKPFL